MLHVGSQNEDRTVETAWTALAPLKQWDTAVLASVPVLPEDTGECISGLVMDKYQVRQTSQRLFRITGVLLQEAGKPLSLQKRVEDEVWEGLPDSSEDVLQRTGRRVPTVYRNLK